MHSIKESKKRNIILFGSMVTVGVCVFVCFLMTVSSLIFSGDTQVEDQTYYPTQTPSIRTGETTQKNETTQRDETASEALKTSLIGLSFYSAWRGDNPLRPGSNEGRIWYFDNFQITSKDRFERWGCSGYYTVMDNWQPDSNWQDAGGWELVVLGEQHFRIDFFPENSEVFFLEFQNDELYSPGGVSVAPGAQGCPP